MLRTIQALVGPALLALSLASAGVALAQSAGASNVTRTPIGDWTKVCVENGPCVLEQIGRTADGKDVLNFQIEKLASSQTVDGQKIEAVANIRVALGVILVNGLRLKIDQGPQSASPFFMCQQGGCIVRAPLQPALLDQLKKGAKATLSATFIIDGKPSDVVSTISLSGFTRAMNEL